MGENALHIQVRARVGGKALPKLPGEVFQPAANQLDRFLTATDGP